MCDDDALVLVFSFKSCSIPISIEISRYELLPRHEPLLPIFLRPHAVQITYKDQCCQLFQNQKNAGLRLHSVEIMGIYSHPFLTKIS